MSSSREIVHSAALMFVSQILTLLISLATTIMIARSLGEESFGVFTSLLALVSLLSIVPDFGFSPIIVRELVRNPNNANRIIGTSLFLRSVLLLGTASLLNIVLFIINANGQRILLINILMLNIIFSSKLPVIRNVFESIYRARLRLGIPLAFSALDGLLLFFLVYKILGPNTSQLSLVVIYTLSNIPGFLFLLFTVLRKKRITLDIDWNLAREFLKYAFPIFLYVVFITIYGNIDILLLQYFSGNYQTGIYAAAARLVGPLLFISNAVTVALYPLLTSMFSESSEKIGKVFRLGFKVLAVAGVGVAIFGCFLSKFIIATLYGGQFQESSTLLVVLFIAQVFAFLSYFFTNVNTAINRQSFNTLVAVCVCVLNLSLNLFFIPRWSAYGAVVVRLATEFGGCVLLWILLLNSIHFERWRDVGKIVLFAALFSGALYLLHGLNVIVFGVLGSMGFLVLLFAVRIFDETEISQLRVALRIGSSQGESRI